PASFKAIPAGKLQVWSKVPASAQSLTSTVSIKVLDAVIGVNLKVYVAAVCGRESFNSAETSVSWAPCAIGANAVPKLETATAPAVASRAILPRRCLWAEDNCISCVSLNFLSGEADLHSLLVSMIET